METICKHGVQVEDGTPQEQLDDLLTGSLPRLAHIIRCWRREPIARKLARMMAARMAHRVGVHIDDATKQVRRLTGLRRIWGK